MIRFDLFLTERQRDLLKRGAEQTGLTAAEILRRMIDHCSQEHVMNAVAPNVSGSFPLWK